MPIQLFLIGVAALLAIMLGRMAYLWFGFRQKRLITCPENRRPAGVRLQAWRAAAPGWGKPDFRLADCTRWPERAGCGQECLRQIDAAPQDCEVRRILAHWYADKSCVSCGQPFGEILWNVQKPALLRADKKSVDWSEIPVDQLPDAMEQSAPICFACHMATKLVLEHPDLAIDRSRSFTQTIK